MDYDFLGPDTGYELRIKRLNEILKTSNRIVFLGGAGVSTASGIPDFRGKNGLYSNPDPEFAQYDPEYLLSATCLEMEPDVFFRFYRKNLDVRNFEPNIVHNTLARMEAEGKLAGIITQNIDCLHERAGSKKVLKIHGTADGCHCSKCYKVYNADDIFVSEGVPRCECGGVIRPDVVLYGEVLNSGTLMSAYKLIEQADCLIICGTSLALAHLRALVSSYTGLYMVVINANETPFDSYADIVFRNDMSEVFERFDWRKQ